MALTALPAIYSPWGPDPGYRGSPPAGHFLSPRPLCPLWRLRPTGLTVVQLAGLGGMGELEVVEVGVLLDWLKISSSM